MDEFDGSWTFKITAVVHDIFVRLEWTWYGEASQEVKPNNFYTSANANGVPNWQNLLQWLKACHAGRCIWWNDRSQGDEEETETALNGTIGILWELRDREWDGVMKVMEHSRGALKLMDDRWE